MEKKMTPYEEDKIIKKTCSFCNITVESNSHPDADVCPKCSSPYGAKQQVKQIKIIGYRPKKRYE